MKLVRLQLYISGEDYCLVNPEAVVVILPRSKSSLIFFIGSRGEDDSVLVCGTPEEVAAQLGAELIGVPKADPNLLN